VPENQCQHDRGFQPPSPSELISQAILLTAAGGVFGATATHIGELLGGLILLMACASILAVAAVSRISRTSPFSWKLFTPWAGGALIATGLINRIAPPDDYRATITVHLVLGAMFVVFGIMNALEERHAAIL
jgi:hypothetical protein